MYIESRPLPVFACFSPLSRLEAISDYPNYLVLRVYTDYPAGLNPASPYSVSFADEAEQVSLPVPGTWMSRGDADSPCIFSVISSYANTNCTPGPFNIRVSPAFLFPRRFMIQVVLSMRDGQVFQRSYPGYCFSSTCTMFSNILFSNVKHRSRRPRHRPVVRTVALRSPVFPASARNCIRAISVRSRFVSMVVPMYHIPLRMQLSAFVLPDSVDFTASSVSSPRVS
jgi:hypothetical protein